MDETLATQDPAAPARGYYVVHAWGVHCSGNAVMYGTLEECRAAASVAFAWIDGAQLHFKPGPVHSDAYDARELISRLLGQGRFGVLTDPAVRVHPERGLRDLRLPKRIAVTARLGLYQEQVPPFTCDLCKTECDTYGSRNSYTLVLATASGHNPHQLQICAECGASLDAGDCLAKLEA